MDEQILVDTINRQKVGRKTARKEFLKQARGTVREYKFNAKKHKLLKTQAKVRLTLKQMGVANRQIPITLIPSRAQSIKVQVR